MRKLDLGECCPDCFAAINYNPCDMPPEPRQRALEAAQKLEALAGTEHAYSLHTDGYRGFSHCGCDGCKSQLSGDRWQLVAWQEERREVI